MKVFWSIIFLLQCNVLLAQFTGGTDDGYSLDQSVNTMSINSGGSEDGYHHLELKNLTSIFIGNSLDGYARGDFINNISIYNGGEDDGFARGIYQNTISIYNGGSEDGYAMGYFTLGIIPLTVSCPANPILASGSDEISILVAYNDWVAGFFVNDGCAGVTSNIGDIPMLPIFSLGAAIDLNFTLSAIDECEPMPITCSSTFTVAGVISCPTDFNIDGITNGDDFSIF